MTRFFVWLGFALGCLGCGAEADVRLVLLTPAGEDPFAGVGVLRLQVESREPGRVVYSGLHAVPDDELALPDLTGNDRFRVVVDGFADASLALLLASGATDWLDPADGDRLEARVCFCLVETLQAGACDCADAGGP